jgi:hypothetical protein
MVRRPDFATYTRDRFAALGLLAAGPDEIAWGRDLAVRTVTPRVASVETLCAMQAHTQCACYVLRDRDGRLDGALSIIPLTLTASPHLAAGELDGVTPSLGLAAAPGQPVIALYGWGMAAVSWRGRAIILNAAFRLHREIHPHLPLYGRAATPGGERSLLKRIGARPVPGRGGLVLAPAWAAHSKAA